MPSRRDFLKGICGVSAVALGSALLADEAAAADGIVRKPNGQVAVTVARIPALAAAGGVVYLGKVRGVPVGVVSVGNGAYRAISLACTHQGVQVKRSGELWRCPAHGSQFTADGTFVAGPAGRDLTSVRSSFNGKVLTVG